ncbi:MAG TPA: type I secretion system permease/ATPase [Alphaproteobacteria bacterium]|nr:type I secretion system permease/ATPase [Alphaproteobacteria bacterium]
MPQSQPPATPAAPATQDSLQACLAWLVAGYRLTHSLTSLVTGLPMKDNRLTPQLFTRAAARAGLNSRVVHRKLADISPHVLPAVFMTTTGRAAILLKREKDDFSLLDPLSGQGQVFKGIAAAEAVYAGYVILVKKGLMLELTDESRDPTKQWFWGTLGQFRPLYGKVAAIALFSNLIGLATPLFAMNVYDRVVPNQAEATLWVLSIGLAVGMLFDLCFRQLRTYFIDVAGKGADLMLASRLYQQLLNLRMGQQNSSAGAFANQLREYDSLRDFFTSSTLATFIDLPFMLLFIFIIFLIGGWLALIPLVAIPLVFVLGIAITRPIKALMREVALETDMKHGHLVETINALENIKALGSQSNAQGKWEALTGATAKSSVRVRFLSQMAMNSTSFMQQFMYVAMVVAGIYLIWAGSLTTGALVACTMLLSRGMQPLSQLAGLIIRYEQSQTALNNLTKLMHSKVERGDGQEFVHVGAMKGKIQFENVDFAYPGTPVDSAKGFSFTIEPGERVGIVGRAGSGKSTIARLLLGLYQPTAGRILLDDLEIRQIDPAEVRQNICYFPQNLYLFRGTLRENLLLAKPDANFDQLIQAAEISGAYRLLRRHPKGFDLPVGERGENLSGGQRQAVGLARALMHDGNMVVLDDPTSELDAQSEAWVIQRLQKWLKDRTLLLITHRPAMLELVDRLIVVDEGKIVADGPKKKVLDWLNQHKTKDMA